MFDAKNMLDALMRGGAQQGHQLSLGLQSTDPLANNRRQERSGRTCPKARALWKTCCAK